MVAVVALFAVVLLVALAGQGHRERVLAGTERLGLGVEQRLFDAPVEALPGLLVADQREGPLAVLADGEFDRRGVAVDGDGLRVDALGGLRPHGRRLAGVGDRVLAGAVEIGEQATLRAVEVRPGLAEDRLGFAGDEVDLVVDRPVALARVGPFGVTVVGGALGIVVPRFDGQLRRLAAVADEDAVGVGPRFDVVRREVEGEPLGVARLDACDALFDHLGGAVAVQVDAEFDRLLGRAGQPAGGKPHVRARGHRLALRRRPGRAQVRDLETVGRPLYDFEGALDAVVARLGDVVVRAEVGPLATRGDARAERPALAGRERHRLVEEGDLRRPVTVLVDAERDPLGRLLVTGVGDLEGEFRRGVVHRPFGEPARVRDVEPRAVRGRLVLYCRRRPDCTDTDQPRGEHEEGRHQGDGRTAYRVSHPVASGATRSALIVIISVSNSQVIRHPRHMKVGLILCSVKRNKTTSRRTIVPACRVPNNRVTPC